MSETPDRYSANVVDMASRTTLRSGKGPPQGPPLQPPSGGDNYGDMDPWQQSVERQLGQLHTDVGGLRGDMRGMLAAFIAGFLFLIATFGSGFWVLTNRIDAKADRLDTKIEASTQLLAAKIDALGSKMDAISERTARLEGASDKPSRH